MGEIVNKHLPAGHLFSRTAPLCAHGTGQSFALQAAGARYTVVPLLGDISRTPFAIGAGLSGFLAPLAAEFNNQLVRQLGSIDAEIIPLNVPLLVDEIVASPAIYGLGPTQSLLGSCFDASGERRPACRWAPCRAHPRG